MVRWLSMMAVLLVLGSFPASAQFGFGGGGEADHVKATLVSEAAEIQPGIPFTVGVRYVMEPEWHIYWLNSGPGPGLPTEVEWRLPAGFEAGRLQWPVPYRFVTPVGDEELVNFGYHDEVVLMAVITPPEELEVGTEVTLEAATNWLACKEVCIPGKATVSVTLPVVAEAPAAHDEHQALLAEMQAKVPVELEGFTATATPEHGAVRLSVAVPEGVESAEFGETMFFPAELGIFDSEAGAEVRRLEDGTLTVRLPIVEDARAPERLVGVFSATGGWGPEGPLGLVIDTPIEALEAGRAAGVPEPPQSFRSIIGNVLLAFLGGLLLNLMPCVLPVLSIKVMDFVKQAGDESGNAWKHGLVFLAGVLLSFWAIAAVSIALKVAGTQLGWAFQFHYPGFSYVLIAVLFVFAMSMFGVFEVGLALTSVGGEVTRKSGLSGSFFSGLLATLVATPCVAPFMGPAVAFAMASPAPVTLLVFTSLGLGMALPYLVLSIFPGLLKYVPKPGAWMETLKQFLGFSLLGVVVWLVWVLAAQIDGNALVAILATLVVMALASWVLGKWAAPHRSRSTRVIARVVSVVLLGGALVYGFAALNSAEAPGAIAEGTDKKIDWVAFDRQEIPELRAQGQAVFVDFTARWCITCQVNERTAFTAAVGEKLRELDIVAMKADWTRRDAKIAEALAEHGRNGVPLYVLYPADPDAEPIILPQLLTEGIVLKALARR